MTKEFKIFAQQKTLVPTPDGTEIVVIVKNGIVYKTTLQAIADLASGGGGGVGTLQLVTENGAITDIPIEVPELLLTDTSLGVVRRFYNEVGVVGVKNDADVIQWFFDNGQLQIYKDGAFALSLNAPDSGSSDVKYPATTSQELVAYRSYVDSEILAIDISGKEDIANKGGVLGNETSTTIYAHAKGVVDYIASLGYQTASMVSSLITSALASFKTTEYLDATSSIQGQLNSRIEYLLNCNVIGTYYSGASNKCLYFIWIPANTFNSLDTIEFETRVEKIGTNGSCAIGLYITTTAPTLGSTLSGGVSIASVGNFAAGSNMMPLKREFVVRGSNLRGITLSNNLTTDEAISTLGTTANQSTDFAFDRTIDNYISVYIQTANASDTFAKHRFQITRMKNKTTI